MQHREPSLRGYVAREEGRGRAHVAEVILCGGMALLSHFPAIAWRKSILGVHSGT
jgi:hypothetical protein